MNAQGIKEFKPELVEVSTVEVVKPRRGGFRLFQSQKTEKMNVLLSNNRPLDVQELHELLAMARYAARMDSANKDMKAMLEVEKRVLAQRQAKVDELTNCVNALNAQNATLVAENVSLKQTLNEMTALIGKIEDNQRNQQKGA